MSPADAQADDPALGKRSAEDRPPDPTRAQTQPPLRPSFAARLAMTLGVWLVAIFAVMALFWVAGDELERQPRPVRAIAMTGVMVLLMMHVVEPVMSRVVRRLASRVTPPSGPCSHALGSPTRQRR